MTPTIDSNWTYDELQTLRGAVRVARSYGAATIPRLRLLAKLEDDLSALMVDLKDKAK